MGHLINLSLVFHTIRHLKFKQVFYRTYYYFLKPTKGKNTHPCLRNVTILYSFPSYIEPATLDGHVFKFLNHKARISKRWNLKELPKLWLYNLHYQDDLNSRGSENRKKLCEHLVDSWLLNNPPSKGIGWESYCISLRVINWIKWFYRRECSDVHEAWLKSLTIQVYILEQKLEYHILANHLFVNAKALIFAGVYLDGEDAERWLLKGVKIIDQEITEQFLSDGAHFELSPMYHSMLLWDLADLINLARTSQIDSLLSREDSWHSVFVAGMDWLKLMIHPDKKISFFNDSTFGVAPSYNDLSNYASFLKIYLNDNEATSKLSSNFAAESGYCIVDWGEGYRLIADLARVGPDYQPGHAHADTLSCELSLFGQRVLVNSGISQYGKSSERQRQRSTCAHNTVEVNEMNSSNVWSGFRVAQRAYPFGIHYHKSSHEVKISGSHNGYCKLFSKVVHRRTWIATTNNLLIEDCLIGRYKTAVAYWHIHPDIKISKIDNAHFLLKLASGKSATLAISGADISIESDTWHSGFGKSLHSNKIVLRFLDSNVITSVNWGSK
jgi:uncharacterized heparinase superfamily protein